MRTALVAAALVAVPISGAALPAAAATPGSARVVIVAVPDLRWADLEVMPKLRAWARTAAAAELSVKTATGTPRCADGSLTFSAGNRANADREFEGCELTRPEFVTLREANRTGKFGAEPGAFGQALADAGLSTAAVGQEAVALLADNSGHVRRTDIVPAIASADVVAVVDDELYEVPSDERADAATSLDGILAAQLGAIPAGTTVMVAGTSDGAETRMHLHTLLIRGPGWRHVALRSPSTRAPYVQLRDLAPTLLSTLHVPIPMEMVGRPAYETSTAVKSPASYADDDDHAVTARDVGRRVRAVFAYAAVAVLAMLVFSWWWPALRRIAIPFGAVAVGAPVCSFLVQVLPWWRWGSWIYGLLVLAGAAVIGVASLVARRRGMVQALAVGPAITAVVLVVDQLVGAPLQLSAPLGDNPIVAGRFHGMGNTDFALMCASVVLCAGLIGGTLRARGRRGVGLAVAASLCLIALVVDAAPMLGDDFGGVLSMGPTAVLLIAVLAGLRITWRRAVIGAAIAVVVAVGVALLDYARPAEHQTHVGRFVGQVLHGGAGRVVHRKLDASLGSFKNAALSILVGAVIVVAVACWQQMRASLCRIEGLTEASVSLAVLAVLGTFLNDSGVVVGGSALIMAVLAAGAAGLGPSKTGRTGNDGAGGSPL